MTQANAPIADQNNPKCECGHERSNHRGGVGPCLGVWSMGFIPCGCCEFKEIKLEAKGTK